MWASEAVNEQGCDTAGRMWTMGQGQSHVDSWLPGAGSMLAGPELPFIVTDPGHSARRGASLPQLGPPACGPAGLRSTSSASEAGLCVGCVSADGCGCCVCVSGYQKRYLTAICDRISLAWDSVHL